MCDVTNLMGGFAEGSRIWGRGSAGSVEGLRGGGGPMARGRVVIGYQLRVAVMGSWRRRCGWVFARGVEVWCCDILLIFLGRAEPPIPAGAGPCEVMTRVQGLGSTWRLLSTKKFPGTDGYWMECHPS
jgi:hypothetical protein